MTKEILLSSALAVLLVACGALDPAAQQKLLYGSAATDTVRTDADRSARIRAGIAIIQRGVTEKDPVRADHYISLGERLLQ